VKRRLSQQAVDRISGKPGEVIWDLNQPGFGVAVGTRWHSYVVQQKTPEGRSRRLIIGRTDEIKYNEASDKGRLAQREIKGKDKAPTPQTLGEVLEDYIASRKDNIRPRTVHEYRYAVSKYAADWLSRDVSRITPEMVRERHQQIGSTVGRNGSRLTSTANGLMKVLKVVLNHAMDRDMIVKNAVSVGLRRSLYKEHRREGHVTADRLADFWKTAEGLPSKTISAFIRMTLATGMRSSECRHLRWEMIGADFITVAGGYTKSGRTLRVPITSLVRAILDERRALVGQGSPWVFPARVLGKCLQEPKRGFDMIAATTGIQVTPHDLGRTFVTIAREAQIDPKHLKLLVNHAVTDMTDSYAMVSDSQLVASAQKVTDLLVASIG
jgi:integrase